MPVRKPLNRPTQSQITPEWALKFARLNELEAIHLDCIRNIACQRTDPNYCPNCDEASDLLHEIVKQYKLPPIVFPIYAQPDDDVSEKEKLQYWTETFAEALVTAREESKGINRHERRRAEKLARET